MVQALHRAGIEVILDVVYNHTAEGNHLGPTLSRSAASTTPPTTGSATTTSASTTTHGHRQHALSAQPAVLQLIMDSLRYWVTRDARRRLPLRPRAEPGAAVPRGGPAARVLRPRAAGSGRLAGQADRRAVGRRPGRLPGRQLPAALDGVERQVPRHGPRLLARRAGVARRVRRRLSGSQRPLRGRRPRALRLDQLRHRARRLHAARPRLYNEKHNEANGEDNNDGEEPQPLLELRRRGADGRPGDPRTARAPAAQHARDAAAQPGRADDPARRRDRPHPERQQQRLLPGQRDLVGRLASDRRGPARVHPDGRRAARGASGVPPPAVLHRRPRRRQRAARHRLAQSDGTRDGRGRLVAPDVQPLAVFLNGAGHRGARPARRADHGRLLPDAASTPRHEDAVDGAARRPSTASAWEVVLDTGERGCRGRAVAAGIAARGGRALARRAAA